MRKKIGIITLHLNYGGVEIASINLANMLCSDYDVTIINMYKSNIVYKLDDRVRIVQLSDLTENRAEFLKNLKKIKLIKTFKEGLKSCNILYKRTQLVKEHLLKNEYDYIISTRVLYNKVLNSLSNKIKGKKIAIEHNHHNNNQKNINKVVRHTKNIDALVLVSKELKDFYENKCKCKCFHIPNVLEYIPKDNEVKIEEKENIILAVGRLEKVKGYLDLIDIFKIVNKKYPEYKLILVGDGKEKENIKNKIKEYDLEEKVILLGFLPKEELNEIYKKSKIYLMTSFEESFGLVVAEAQSFKIPVIAFETARGVVELLNGTGIVIKNRDKNKMAEETINLINNKILYENLSKKSYNNILRFSFNNIKKQWLEFLEEIK